MSTGRGKFIYQVKKDIFGYYEICTEDLEMRLKLLQSILILDSRIFEIDVVNEFN